MASVATHMSHGDLDNVLRAPVQQPVVWKRTWVQERPAHYGITGEGRPIVFLHGWALAHHTYRGVLQSLGSAGWRVVAPALPGFGGTPGLPGAAFSLAGYADWLAEFLAAVGIDDEAVLIGHSFGGGVAIRTAYDHPDLVRSLALVNSIGGSSWRRGEVLTSIADRPLWDWGLHFPADVWPFRQATRVLPVILEDAIPNLLRNPRSVVRVANLARRADLRGELEELNRRGLPVTIIWSSRDGIIPRESFEAMCAAAGTTGREVEGSHSWLLADPGRFVEVITNDLTVAEQAQRRSRRPLRRFRRLR